MTDGAISAGHSRLSVRLSVRSSQPEPFGPEAVVDDGPTGAEGSPGTKLAASFDRRAPRARPWPLPRASRHCSSRTALLRRGH